MTSLEFIYTVVLRPPVLRKCANATLRSIIPRSVKCHGATIVLNPTDPVVSGALMLRSYEKTETSFFLRTCRPGMTVVDIGANVGYYTALALSRMQGRGRIIAFEPDPENFRYLQQTVAANNGFIATCLQKAVSDSAGSMTLYTSRDNRGDNRLYANELCTDACQVDVVPVDTALAELGIQQVDFIKMDVQGYEAHVIGGMVQTLRNSSPIIVLSEFWPYGLRAAGSDPVHMLEFLEQLGFELYELTYNREPVRLLDHNGLVERFCERRYTNILALKGTTLEMMARSH